MRNDYFDDLVPGKDVPGVPGTYPADRVHPKARHIRAEPGVPGVPGKNNGVVQNAAGYIPLAAKLRAAGCPIALEVEGEVVAWLVSDEDAVRRTDLTPRFTAAEAEVLAQFDAKGMYDLIEMKAKLGGKLSRDA